MNDWFKVDKEGLRKILERRGKQLVLFELLQNSFDVDAKNIEVILKKLPGRPFAHLIVKDDHPEGYTDLSHSFTLFAESEKKADPEKRGWMNLGEKLVLAMCKWAKVSSTKGTVHFNEDGTMTRGRKKTESGSVFEAAIRLNQTEFDEVAASFWRLIPPDHCNTTLQIDDGAAHTLPKRTPICTFEASLPTQIADEEGLMRRTVRKATVEVYDLFHETEEGEDDLDFDDEGGWLYEMGIPVVETGDRYYYNVLQKVPVNMDRDNVPPGYLKKLRALVLNHTVNLLTENESAESWVTNALESDDVESAAVNTTMDKRFGEKRASYDPNDPESSKNLMAKGYTIVHGRTLPEAAWDSVRRSGAIRSSSSIAPTPKPYSDDPNAPEVKVVPKEKWNEGMREIAVVARVLAQHLIGVHDLQVRYVLPTQRHWGACCDGYNLDFNVSAMGYKYFQNWHDYPHKILSTLVHEFAHGKAEDHLDETFHKECTRMAGEGMVLVMRKMIPYLTSLLHGYCDTFESDPDDEWERVSDVDEDEA